MGVAGLFFSLELSRPGAPLSARTHYFPTQSRLVNV